MKKKQTAKYKRRKKKELANRKARQLPTQQQDNQLVDSQFIKDQKLAAELGILEYKPVSPARRAFQDV